ncbi:MAG: YqiA/YcfP family alpha/beta fold hydrolase [Ideonella sp.]
MKTDSSTSTGPRLAVPVTHLLYLHGFRSSPLSTKAQQMAHWVARHRPEVVWRCPQLPASPASTLTMLRTLMSGWPAAGSAIVGSSLGGFYATVLGEELACRTLLINPAIDPARGLASAVGSTTMWHSAEPFEFRAEYVDELRQMTPTDLFNLQQTWALIAKGDEVLDWREMTARYPSARITLLEGGDHAFSGFADHLPQIAEFFGWATMP